MRYFYTVNNRHGVTITTHATKRHFLIWMTTVRQPTERRCSCVLTLKYIFICVHWWTRQRIHNTLIVVDRYLRLMGDKTIPDSAEPRLESFLSPPRLESFYPPFVTGIDLPHQCVVDSYNHPLLSPTPEGGGILVDHWSKISCCYLNRIWALAQCNPHVAWPTYPFLFNWSGVVVTFNLFSYLRW